MLEEETDKEMKEMLSEEISSLQLPFYILYMLLLLFLSQHVPYITFSTLFG